jgi:hypothetical protein
MKTYRCCVLLVAVGAMVSACASPTRRSPALTAPPASAQPAGGVVKKNALEEAGEATWRVVTAPARLIPGKKPAEAKQEEGPSEPPSAVIVRRTYGGDEAGVAGAATQP